MFTRYFAAIALAAAAVLGQQISTPPTLTVCQPTLLSWTGGSQPYFLSVIPGGQASAAALKDFGQQTGNSYTWNVDLPAGTSITLKLTDSTGNTVYSSPVTIQAGTSTACLNAASGSSSAAAFSVAASSTGGAVVGGASSAVSSAMASASSVASSAVASASSAAGSATRSSSAAASTGASSMATSARSSAASGASSVAAGASSVASGASSAAASATSNASSANKLVVSGLGAVLLSAAGIILA